MPINVSIRPKNDILRKFVAEILFIEVTNQQLISKDFIPKNGMVWTLTNSSVSIGKSKFSNFLIGIHTEPLSMKCENGKGIFVKFSPFGMSRFTDMQIDKFTSKVVNSISVWGKAVNEFGDALLNITNVNNQVSIIEDFLIARLRNPLNIEQSIFDMIDLINQNDDLSIAELKETIPLSSRQLERNFKKIVGVNIQTYIRINRFQKAFVQMQIDNNKLTQIGYNSGYFDQSHFSRDFKGFTNFRPNNFFEKSDFYYQLKANQADPTA